MADRIARIVPPLVLAALSVLAWFPAGLGGKAAAYAVLMFFPGLGLYLLLERRPSPMEALLSTIALSPVITCGLAILFVVAGLSLDSAVIWNLVTASILAMAGAVSFAVSRDRTFHLEMTGRQWVVVGVVVVATLVLVGYLPATSEWWRVRSDAWFHRAVVAQVDDFGLPPEDPYFVGFTLQYMWFYHVLVLSLSKAMSLDPFRVMTFLNLQGTTGVFLAVMLFAGVFVRRFGRRLGSYVTVILGLNGFFWLFLPLKVVRAFKGEVRGVEELSRTFSISPWDIQRAMEYFLIYYNQDFLLDKFVVATAFGIAACCMAVFWYATSEYLRSQRPFLLAAVMLALIGMLGFHTVFGMIMFVAAFGGLGLSFVFRGRVSGFRLGPLLGIAAACVAALAVASPYLYSITRLKESQYRFPFAVTLPSIAGIVITCASAAFLAAFQRNFFRNREMTHRYVQYALYTTTVFCALIVLPQQGSADKIPFFVFFPLAVIGGWSLVDLVGGRRTMGRKIAAGLTVAVLFFLPVNVLSFVAYFNTPTPPVCTVDEEAVAAWVRDNTPREAVVIDRDEEVFLLVRGPRRYFCGRWAYAYQWGYDKVVMSGRIHARDALYRDKALDLTTLRVLGEAPWELYVIDRRDQRSAPSALELNRSLFEKVYSAGALDLYRIDVAACAAAAGELRRAGQTEVPEEELVRESGL